MSSNTFNLLCVLSLLFICSLLSAQTETLKDTVEIQEIVVSRKQTTTFSGLSQGKIQLKPATLQKIPFILGNLDLLGVLRLTPGVQNAGDSNTDMYIRGGEPGQNLLLYNDAPIYAPGHLLGFLPLFNADHLSVLEMSSSAIPARLGGKLSAAMEAKSKNTIPSNPELRGSVGLISSQVTAAIPIGKKFAAYISGRGTYLSLILPTVNNAFSSDRDPEEDEDRDSESRKIDDFGYDFYDTNITLLGRLSDQHSLSVDVLASTDHLDVSETDILLNGYVDWTNIAGSIQWDYEPDEERKLHQSVFYSDYKNKLSVSQADLKMGIRAGTKSMGYNATYSFPVRSTNMQTGIQYAYITSQPQRQQIQNIDIDFAANPDTLHRAHDAAIFITAQRELLPRLNSEFGIRYTFFHSRNADYQALEPRVSFRYELAENRYLRASFNRHNQYMHRLSSSGIGIPCDFWMLASNEIQPQSGNTFSAGYYHIFARSGYELSADVYYRKMNCLSEYDYSVTSMENASLYQAICFGKGQAYGLELMLKKNWGKLTGWLSYALARSEREFDDINNGEVFPARYDRRHDFSAVASYTFNDRWDASLVQVFSSGGAYTLPTSWYFIGNTPVKQYGEYNSARMPDYNRTDISVNYWFRPDNGINLSVYNLFMVENPIYVFLSINHDKKKGKIIMDTKKKLLSTIIPSISWRFKF